MNKRVLWAALLLSCLLCARPAASAEGYAPGKNQDYLLLPEEEVQLWMYRMKEWTLVTPDTMEEHMALLTSRGDSEEDVRYRFAHGNILLEAYHEKLPDGRMRVQVFEDDQSRSVWNLKILTKKQYVALKKELQERLYQGYLHLFNVKGYAEEYRTRDYTGSVIAYPPFAYESGLFMLRFFNGRAYLVTYTQPVPGSSAKLYDGTMFGRVQGFVLKNHPELVGKERAAAADLTHDRRLILNAHSGTYTFAGASEKGASVTVETGGRKVTAQVDGDGKYTARITLAPGDNAVVARAQKEKLADNALTRVIPVNDGMAALELTDYPYDAVDRGKMKAAGRTSPGARVTVKIDGGKPEKVKVKKDGSFSWDVKVEDWTEHTIEITASEDGLTDCTAKFTFRPVYEDAAKGIQAFQKTLDKGVNGKKISADPGGYVGKRVKMEVYTTKAQRRDGRLILHGNISRDKKMPVILVCPDYLEDRIQDKMLLTVYGTVTEPSRADPAVPRLDVEYIRYQKTVYKRNPYPW